MRKKGFTLIEIMMSLAIMTLLLTVSIPAIMPQLERSQVRSEADQVRSLIHTSVAKSKLTHPNLDEVMALHITPSAVDTVTIGTQVKDLETSSYAKLLPSITTTTPLLRESAVARELTIADISLMEKGSPQDVDALLLVLEPLSNRYFIYTPSSMYTAATEVSFTLSPKDRDHIRETIAFSPLTGLAQ